MCDFVWNLYVYRVNRGTCVHEKHICLVGTNDFVVLSLLNISTHMQDLQEVTQEVHYENYRSDRLAKGVKIKVENGLKSERDSVLPTQITANSEKDRILQEKEAELRRMQEMLAQMQAKMQAHQ